MEIRFTIVAVACLSCMVPPTLGIGLVTKAAAIGGAKGALLGGVKGAAIGAGIGLVAKGAAGLVTKKALLSIALKAAAIKGTALLSAKKAIVKKISPMVVKGITAAKGLVTSLTSKTRAEMSIPQISILDILSGAAAFVQSLSPRVPIAPERAQIMYRIISAPRVYEFAVPVAIAI